MNITQLPTGEFDFITVEEPDETLDELEQKLKEQLAHLQQSYQRAAEPIIQHLVRISSYRKRRYYLVPKRGTDHD